MVPMALSLLVVYPLYQGAHLYSRAIAVIAAFPPLLALWRTFMKDMRGEPARLLQAIDQMRAPASMPAQPAPRAPLDLRNSGAQAALAGLLPHCQQRQALLRCCGASASLPHPLSVLWCCAVYAGCRRWGSAPQAAGPRGLSDQAGRAGQKGAAAGETEAAAQQTGGQGEGEQTLRGLQRQVRRACGAGGGPAAAARAAQEAAPLAAAVAPH